LRAVLGNLSGLRASSGIDHAALRANAASAGSLSSLPLTVRRAQGIFTREGLNLVVVPIPGGTDRIVAALDKARSTPARTRRRI